MLDVKMVIVVRKDLNTRKGKLATQVASAAMGFLIDNSVDNGMKINVDLSQEEAEWFATGMKKTIVSVSSEDALRDIVLSANIRSVECHSVYDANETLVCVALGPDDADSLNNVIGHLPLLA